MAAFGRLGLVDPEGSRPRLRTRLRRAQVELPKWIQPGAGTPADSVIFEVDDLEPVELEKKHSPILRQPANQIKSEDFLVATPGSEHGLKIMDPQCLVPWCLGALLPCCLGGPMSSLDDTCPGLVSTGEWGELISEAIGPGGANPEADCLNRLDVCRMSSSNFFTGC